RAVHAAVARVHDGPLFIVEPVALHALDEGKSDDRRVLFGALAFGATPGRGIVARLAETLHQHAFVDAILLRDAEPAFRLSGAFPRRWCRKSAALAPGRGRCAVAACARRSRAPAWCGPRP